jgi:hypothetical protein
MVRFYSWVNFFKELFGLENLRFQRCVQPENAIGDPMLVVFSDGSKIAYGACAYVRWQVGGYLKNCGPFCHIEFISKSRGDVILVVRSAAFLSVGIHHHSDGSVLF